MSLGIGHAVTRPLRVVDSRNAETVFEAVRAALAGDGAAILPHEGSPEGLPETVEQRVALVVETSGSTGNPKRVALSADALLASAAASESALGGPGQWLLALPAHYIAGINVLVRSLASGTEPVILDAGHFSAERFVAAAERLDGATRFTSLVPTQLARLIDADVALEPLRRFDRILVGGQAAPVPLLARALELGLNVTTTYGSSETSGGCVYDGVPFGNVELRIQHGQVEIAGPMLAEAYLGDPARTEETFVHDGGRRWYRTGDAGELRDGVLRVTGRLDDVIISGGIKVSLGEVEALIRGFPGLGSAVAIAGRDDDWGEVPVIVSTASVDLEELRALVGGRLGRAAAPARVVVVERIPLLASGKPDRRALRGELGG